MLQKQNRDTEEISRRRTPREWRAGVRGARKMDWHVVSSDTMTGPTVGM